MKIIYPKLYNNERIKLQGISYYSDCYNLWDLNHCSDNFDGDLYNNVIDRIKNGTHNLYSEQGTMSVIDFEKYEYNCEQYYNSLSRNVRRDIEACEKKKYYVREYDFNKFTQDFLNINTSQYNKKGNLNPWYLQKPENYSGMHIGRDHRWEDQKHYSLWYGIFKYLKNYKQGDTITNERLYGYCKVAFEGETACVHLVFADANYLRDGVMMTMLVSVIKNAIKQKGVRYMIYYGHGQYPKWKERMLFEPSLIRATL